MSKLSTFKKAQKKAARLQKKNFKGPLDKCFERADKTKPKNNMSWKEYAEELEDVIKRQNKIAVSRAVRLYIISRSLWRLEEAMLVQANLTTEQMKVYNKLFNPTFNKLYVSNNTSYKMFKRNPNCAALPHQTKRVIHYAGAIRQLREFWLEPNCDAKTNSDSIPWSRVDDADMIEYDAQRYRENDDFPTDEEYIPERPSNLK